MFVDSELDVPEGAVVVLSAHGVAPEVYERSRERSLHVLDATCPLVTKVHAEARKYAAQGYSIVLIGHEGHEEVVGTMGEAPQAIQLIGSVGEIDAARDPRSRPGGIHHPDHALGGRDARDHRRPPRAFPQGRRPAEMTTSVTPPRTAKTRSKSSPRMSIWCS